jgi:hypothetical protein
MQRCLFGSWTGRFRVKSDVGTQTGLDSACDQVRVPLSYVPLDVTALQVAPSSIAYCILNIAAMNVSRLQTVNGILLMSSLDRRMGLRQAHDARRASAQAPAGPGSNTA